MCQYTPSSSCEETQLTIKIRYTVLTVAALSLEMPIVLGIPLSAVGKLSLLMHWISESRALLATVWNIA